MFKSKTLLKSFFAVSLFVASASWACMNLNFERDQIIVQNVDFKEDAAVVATKVVKVGSLVTIWTDKMAKVSQEGSALESITEAAYVEASKQGRGMPYPYPRPDAKPFSAKEAAGLKRFVAQAPGVSNIVLKLKGITQVVRVEVVAPDDKPNIIIVSRSMSTANIRYGELLYVDVEGSAASAWRVDNPAALGLTQQGMDVLSDGVVRFKFKAGAEDTYEGKLKISGGTGAALEIQVRRQPTPKC